MSIGSKTSQWRRRHPRYPGGGRPAWEIAYLFPAQGNWSEEDYLGLEDTLGGHIRVELTNGRIEVLPMPTEPHQFIILFLIKVLEAYALAHCPGVVLFSGIRVRLRKGKRPKFREPDVVFMKEEHGHRRHKEFWDGADLVMEIVSGDPKDRDRDWVTKAREYAKARIPEYWIVDPERQIIRVLVLNDKTYDLHGDFGPGQTVTSVLLPRFAVAVDAILTAGSRN